MTFPIADIHCDLLSFLAEGRSVDDKVSRCSYSDLVKGGVKFQVLALFSHTKTGSSDKGKKQVSCFLDLLAKEPLRFTRYDPGLPFPSSAIAVLPAFESASVFAEEEEPLNIALNRLDSYLALLGPLFYISLTWDLENRFGGGNRSTVGLKEDGKHLLEHLSGKQIAVDLSHTSDRLACELIDWIDKRGLQIPLIASHSNFRAVTPQLRNLPDDLAKELIRRKGLIGLNFFSPFVHETDPSALLRHLEYGLSLGGQEALCFGADFFFIDDAWIPALRKKYNRETLFFKELADASVYPWALDLFQTNGKIGQEQLQKITSQNVLSFLKRVRN